MFKITTDAHSEHFIPCVYCMLSSSTANVFFYLRMCFVDFHYVIKYVSLYNLFYTFPLVLHLGFEHTYIKCMVSHICLHFKVPKLLILYLSVKVIRVDSTGTLIM